MTCMTARRAAAGRAIAAGAILIAGGPAALAQDATRNPLRRIR